MDLAPIYQTLNADPETVLVAHHGQVTVIHKGRPAINRATLEIFELGQQIDLATVIRLATTLGLARDDRRLVTWLDEQLTELEAENAGLLDDTRRLRAWLDQAILRLGAAEQDLQLLYLQLEQSAQRGERLAESLRFADQDRAELRRQNDALRRVLDAAEQAGKRTLSAAAAAPTSTRLPSKGQVVETRAINAAAAATPPIFHEASEPGGSMCTCGFQSFSPKSLQVHIGRANKKAAAAADPAAESAEEPEPAAHVALSPAAAAIVEAVTEQVAAGDAPTQRWPDERPFRLLEASDRPAPPEPVRLPTEVYRERVAAQHAQRPPESVKEPWYMSDDDNDWRRKTYDDAA